MHTIHCHFCGGVVRDRATIEYRPQRSSAQVFALPQGGTCTCTPPIVYDDSPLDAHPTNDERVARVEPVERVAHVAKVEHVERHEHDASRYRPDPSDPWKGAV